MAALAGGSGGDRVETGWGVQTTHQGDPSHDPIQGTHEIHIDHAVFGQTCGVLPLGVDAAHVVTRGLKWDIGAPGVQAAG